MLTVPLAIIILSLVSIEKQLSGEFFEILAPQETKI